MTVAVVLGWAAAHRDRTRADEGVILFTPFQAGLPIVVPASATEAERRAAETLQGTLARASGGAPESFPILEERGGVPRRAIWVGATRRGRNRLHAEAPAPLDSGIGWAVAAGSLFLKGERRESIEAAAGRFLETQLGAQWFMPGPLGEHVLPRRELHLPPGEQRERPGFVHRDLGFAGGPEVQAWYGRNGLQARFEHQHNLANIFRPEDFQRSPEMAPVRNGQKVFPREGSQNWQPNLLSMTAVRHAARVAIDAFDRDPARLSFSLSLNDSDLFDETEETLAAVSPPRFFRHRPDYSPLVFGFTNAVARLVAQRHPDRWLPAYAYYWCENVPDFPVEPNVVPFLTADRSQWSHPAFAAEDKALIERWCRSGAQIVGVYDYFYGAPHLAPRPTLYAVQESIPFHHRAGVRAFYAETSSNWGLDGPKAWLAAQLLWNPERHPDELLDLYYREFWRESAGPMRAFFATAERTWRNQPGPPLWLRFFRDDDQSWIYPAERRAELRAHLNRAREFATTDTVRARVAFTDAALTVSEAFWEFAGSREVVSGLARPGADPKALARAWTRYRQAREGFVERFGAVRQAEPLAIAPQDIAFYLRNQPDSRVARELAGSEAGRTALTREEGLLAAATDATVLEIARVLKGGDEVLEDPRWLAVETRPVGSSAANDWTPLGSVWRGSGEAWEGRTVELSEQPGRGRVLKFSGCRTEVMAQWTEVTPGALYAAMVEVRAKVSPGTATYLILSFLDDAGKHIGLGRVDRLPPQLDTQEATLCVMQRAPARARHVGVGLCAWNQIGHDFVEFSGASLRRLVP